MDPWKDVGDRVGTSSIECGAGGGLEKELEVSRWGGDGEVEETWKSPEIFLIELSLWAKFHWNSAEVVEETGIFSFAISRTSAIHNKYDQVFKF